MRVTGFRRCRTTGFLNSSSKKYSGPFMRLVEIKNAAVLTVKDLFNNRTFAIAAGFAVDFRYRRIGRHRTRSHFGWTELWRVAGATGAFRSAVCGALADLALDDCAGLDRVCSGTALFPCSEREAIVPVYSAGRG